MKKKNKLTILIDRNDSIYCQGGIFTFGTSSEGAYTGQGAYFSLWDTTECSRIKIVENGLVGRGYFLARATSQAIATKFEKESIHQGMLHSHGHNSWET